MDKSLKGVSILSYLQKMNKINVRQLEMIENNTLRFSHLISKNDKNMKYMQTYCNNNPIDTASPIFSTKYGKSGTIFTRFSQQSVNFEFLGIKLKRFPSYALVS